MQFDGQLKTAAEAYAQSDQSPADYKKYKTKVKEIRDKVRKYTGGYEIGYVDFDKNGKAIPITPQSSMLEGKGELGKRTTGIKNFFKNMQFHNRLFENHKKNKNNPDFYTLNQEINNSKLDFTPEYEIEKEYDKIKNFKKVSQFQNYFKTAPDNSFFKSLFTGRGGKVALTATTGATLATLLMAAGPKEKGLTTAEVMARKDKRPGPFDYLEEDEGFTDTEKLLAGTTAGGAAFAARRPLLKTAAAIARPFGLPTVAAGFGLGQFVDINPFRFATEEEREAGKSFITRDEKFGSLKEDPSFALAGADLLLPELTKQVGIRSLLANPFGRLARGFTPLGIGLQGIELINQARKEQRRIDAMSPEEREDFIAEQESLLDFSA